MYELLFPNISGNLVTVLEIIDAILEILFFTLLVVGEWHLLKKMNEKPWKALIPIYNVYTIFKHVWKKSAFWIYFAGLMGYTIFFAVSEVLAQTVPNTIMEDVFLLISLPFAIVMIIYSILSNFRIAEAFGKGRIYGLCLTVFYEIFILVLGLGKSEFVLNKEPCVAEGEEPAELESADELTEKIPEKETIEE